MGYLAHLFSLTSCSCSQQGENMNKRTWRVAGSVKQFNYGPELVFLNRNFELELNLAQRAM